jgi:MFS superfamily sulfate permease-like transporter
MVEICMVETNTYFIVYREMSSRHVSKEFLASHKTIGFMWYHQFPLSWAILNLVYIVIFCFLNIIFNMMHSYAYNIPSGTISSDFLSAHLYVFLNLDVCNIIKWFYFLTSFLILDELLSSFQYNTFSHWNIM